MSRKDKAESLYADILEMAQEHWRTALKESPENKRSPRALANAAILTIAMAPDEPCLLAQMMARMEGCETLFRQVMPGILPLLKGNLPPFTDEDKSTVESLNRRFFQKPEDIVIAFDIVCAYLIGLTDLVRMMLETNSLYLTDFSGVLTSKEGAA